MRFLFFFFPTSWGRRRGFFLLSLLSSRNKSLIEGVGSSPFPSTFIESFPVTQQVTVLCNGGKDTASVIKSALMSDCWNQINSQLNTVSCSDVCRHSKMNSFMSPPAEIMNGRVVSDDSKRFRRPFIVGSQRVELLVDWY